MPADKPTELSRIKLKTWTRQPVPMISKHSAHPTPLPVGFGTWLWRYTCLLLLISMLWHRQAIFKSKGDKLSSSAECRIWTRGLRHQIASRLNVCWQTDWAIEDQAKNLNSTARPYDQQAFSPPDPIASWLWHLALAIYMFVVVNFDALAQASDIQIERRQVNCGDDKCGVEIKLGTYQRHPTTSQVSYGVSMVSIHERDEHIIVLFLCLFFLCFLVSLLTVDDRCGIEIKTMNTKKVPLYGGQYSHEYSQKTPHSLPVRARYSNSNSNSKVLGVLCGFSICLIFCLNYCSYLCHYVAAGLRLRSPPARRSKGIATGGPHPFLDKG